MVLAVAQGRLVVLLLVLVLVLVLVLSLLLLLLGLGLGPLGLQLLGSLLALVGTRRSLY